MATSEVAAVAPAPSRDDASINAALLLQKSVFEKQCSYLQDVILVQRNSVPIVLDGDLKVPHMLLNRSLPSEFKAQGRAIDNEEITILGMLDSKGKISSYSRLTEFMVFMTRIKKIEHRALCIQILASKMTDQCKKYFTAYGGFRLMKRWLKTAEEEDSVTELTTLVKLCKVLPFNETAIREVGIAKVIKKLLKFQSKSSSSTETTALHAQVESLMNKWRAKQQLATEKTAAAAKAEAAAASASEEKEKDNSGGGVIAAEVSGEGGVNLSSSGKKAVNSATTASITTTTTTAVTGSLVDAIQLKLQSVHSSATTAASTDPSVGSAEAKEGDSSSDVAPMDVAAAADVTATATATPSSSSTSTSSSSTGRVAAPLSILQSLTAAAAAANAANTTNAVTTATGGGELTSAEDASQQGLVVPAAPAVPAVVASVPAVSSVPVIPVARERKHVDMAEGARKLLAKRAQQKQRGSSSSSSSSTEGAGAGANTPAVLGPVDGTGDVGDATACASASALKGAMKKPTTGSGAGAGAGARKPQAVKWADQNGGLLREIRTIEVEKIKRSTAHYSSTRDLSKRERQQEKEVHASKAEETMQKTTDWRTPKSLSLSIVVLDNIGAVAESAERETQERRLATVLEVRYLDDSLIPLEPDEAASAKEDSSFSSIGGSSGERDIPWYQPGTEPSPLEAEEFSLRARERQGQGMIAAGGGGAAADHVTTQQPFNPEYAAIIAQLPPSLQQLGVETIQMIVQDPALLQSIMRPDGTVDEHRLSILQQHSRSNSSYLPYPHSQQSLLPPQLQHYQQQQPQPQQQAPFGHPLGAGAGGGGGMRSSRFSQPAGGGSGIGSGSMGVGGPAVALDAFQAHAQAVLLSGSAAAGGRPAGGPGPGPGGGPGGGGGGRRSQSRWTGGGGGDDIHVSHSMNMNMNMNMNNNNHNNNHNHSNPAVVAGGGGGGVGGRFPTTKAATPCRFFNTSKGCQNGDKCPFGHFLPDNGAGNMNARGPGGGGGPGRGRGPGGGPGGGGMMFPPMMMPPPLANSTAGVGPGVGLARPHQQQQQGPGNNGEEAAAVNQRPKRARWG